MADEAKKDFKVGDKVLYTGYTVYRHCSGEVISTSVFRGEETYRVDLDVGGALIVFAENLEPLGD